MRKTTRFDAADYLDTEERQVAYISRRRSKRVAPMSYVTRLVSLHVHAA
jgi:hypothetical protein